MRLESFVRGRPESPDGHFLRVSILLNVLLGRLLKPLSRKKRESRTQSCEVSNNPRLDLCVLVGPRGTDSTPEMFGGLMMRACLMNPTCLRQRRITRGWISVLLMALWGVMVADSDAQERDEPLNPQYEKLLNQLGDDSFQVRERATQELIELGSRARIEVIAASDSPDLEIRSRAQRIYEEWSLTKYLVENPNEIDFLNPKQAAQLVSKYPGTLFLPNLTVIVNGKEVGRELEKFKGYLSLGGLQSIEKDFARGLATSSARKLDLDGLTSVDKEVARELAQFKGRYLWLRKLKSIDKDVARELASFKNELRLDGLTSMDQDVAQELSKSTANMYFDGLTSIGKDVAQLFAKSTARGLSFNGLESIDKGVVRELASFQGGLFLNGLKSMDQDVAKELAKFAGRTLHLGGLKSVDEVVLQQLEEWKVRYLSLNGLEAINTGLARALAKSKVGSMNFYGVASIDEEVAQELAKFEGEYLCLGGLKSMDKGVAQKLAKLKARKLKLQALEFMEKDVAQELAKFKGELAMFCLKSIDKEVALGLARYSGTKMSFGTYLTVSDEDILEVLRSNPKIELPQKYRNSKKTSQGTE